MIDINRKEKYCPVCDEVKSIDDFYNDIKSRDGKSGICKECRKVGQKDLRSRPEVQEYQRAYQKNYNRRSIKK